MALKFFCDICEKECNDPEFVFDGTVMEIKEIFDLTQNKLNVPVQRKMEKKQIQICKGCYEKNLKSLLK